MSEHKNVPAGALSPQSQTEVSTPQTSRSGATGSGATVLDRPVTDNALYEAPAAHKTAPIRETFHRLREEIGKTIVGQEELVEHVLLALATGGHLLLEGAPGLGKTLLVRTLGAVTGCSFKRLQFTPDLMPSDVTGGHVFNQKTGAFDFNAGPVFTQLLLADEINRTPAKTQAALLEAMQEHTVSIDGTTKALPHPFFVMATQNPIESQGTYPLPEAQLDRFLMKLHVPYPTPDEEKLMLRGHLSGFDANQLSSANIQAVCTPEALLSLRAQLTSVRVDNEIVSYATEIVVHTRNHRSLLFGASPRASLALVFVARARGHAGSRFCYPG